MDKLKMPTMPEVKMPTMPEVKMPTMPEVKMPEIDLPPIGVNDIINNPAAQTISKFSGDIFMGFIVLFILATLRFFYGNDIIRLYTNIKAKVKSYLPDMNMLYV